MNLPCGQAHGSRVCGRTEGMDEEKRVIISTRPLDRVEALDQSLAEAVARVRNDPAAAKACFAAMRDSIASAPNADAWLQLVKKLVATALTHWTPATLDPAGFAAAADAAGFKTATYGKPTITSAVVREPVYASGAGVLNRSICKAFTNDVLKLALQRMRGFKKASAEARTFADHMPALLRAGSLDEQGLAPRTSGGQVVPLPRFTLDER